MDTMVNQLEAEGFTRNQIDEIVKCKEAGLDVDIYTRKEFLTHLFEDFTREKSVTESKIAGMNGHIAKPIVVRDLMKTLARII